MGIEVKLKSCPKIETKVKCGNWRSGASKPNLSVVSLACLSSKAWPLRVLQFWRPALPSFPSPTATGTGTQICLADRMRYNDNADDARNELQLLRLECATILVEQSSLDWLHLSGQWDLCTVQKSGQSGLCGCLASFGLILGIVYGFQVCVDLCNHFMVTQQQIAPPSPIITVQLSQKSTQVGSNPFSSSTASHHMRPCRGLCFFWSNSLECQQISLTAIW